MSGTPANDDAQAEWLRRVLGFAVPSATAAGTGAAPAATPGATPGATPDWASARQGWQAASEAVDGQIAGLQAVLRKTGDDQLEEIAEFGLNGVTGDHRVKLMAILMELGSGDPATLRKSGPKALGLIESFRSYLESNEKVQVCDANPFGAPVAIRATLVPALTQMAAALQAASQP